MLDARRVATRSREKENKERQRVEARKSEMEDDGGGSGGDCGCDGRQRGSPRTHIHKDTGSRNTRPPLTELEIGVEHLRVNNNAWNSGIDEPI